MTDEAFGQGFTVLRQMFPAREFSKGTIREYRDALDYLSNDVWRLVVKRCVATMRFLPSVAEIRDVARDVAADAYGIPSGDEAWGAVMTLARRWYPGAGSIRGRVHPAVFDALAAIGGVRAVALADDGASVGRLERAFRKAYERSFAEEADALCEMALSPEETAAALSAGSIAVVGGE